VTTVSGVPDQSDNAVAASHAALAVSPSELVALRYHLREALTRLTARQVFEHFIAENDALIRRPDLDDGRQIVGARTMIHVELVRHWAATEHQRHGYAKPFAVVALGGTGRGEIAPRSDIDFAFLFDDALEENDFLGDLQRQVLHTDAFFDSYGFRFEPLPFNLDDVSTLAGTQLNSFLDLRPVYDPDNLTERFVERIRATYDPFEHFLFLRNGWLQRWERKAGDAERLDAFDIKHDALRVFQAGIWTLAGREFRHSHEVYAELADPRDLEAYSFLLRLRCLIHTRRPATERAAGPGEHPEDRLAFEDFASFGDWLGLDASDAVRFEFAHEVRERLLAARRRVARFATSVLARELTPGRAVGPDSPLVYRLAGLAHTGSAGCTTTVAKSRVALSLLLAAQHYEVPIDPAEIEATFRDAGDWLTPVPELSALFYEPRGSLAKSFEFLAQFDGALERLFPGYARFETSIDARVMQERSYLRGVMGRKKLEVLEVFVRVGRDALRQAVGARRAAEPGDAVDPRVEAALLGPDELAAVKLALTTKRLPLTEEDVRQRLETALPLYERLASGFSDVPLASYYEPYCEPCGFSEETLRLARFLVANRRAFKERAGLGVNDDLQVEEFAALCGSEQALRSLFVFTCADRADWETREQEPARWFRIDELYTKAIGRLRPGIDPKQHLRNAGFSPVELAILEDLGPDFFGGVYRPYAVTFGTHLLRLVDDGDTTPPRATLLRSGASRILGVAARDFRGLAASITGELWQRGVNLRQAHLFSARQYGLALDFFHLAPSIQPVGNELTRAIEVAIRERRHIDDAAATGLPSLELGRTSLLQRRPGFYLLRHETPVDASGLVYALAYRVFRHLRANIFALDAQTTRHGAFVSIYVGLPPGLELDAAQEVVRRCFR
jgi:hypothetical protein